MSHPHIEITIAVLKHLDEKQLIELFHDIEDINIVARIADVAYYFVENYPHESNLVEGKPEYQEAKELDDLQRYADIKSTQDSFK